MLLLRMIKNKPASGPTQDRYMTTEHFPNSINNKSDLTYSHGGRSETAIAGGRLGRAGGLSGKLVVKFAFSSISSNRLSRRRRRFGALFFGCRSRPAQASFSIFAPTASRPSGLSRPQLCLSASSLISPAPTGSPFFSFADSAPFSRESFRRRCGRRVSRRR